MQIGRLKTAACRTKVLALTVLLAGCSGNADHGTISGAVIFDGQPLKSGIIRFTPADGKSAPAEAKITDGKYSTTASIGEKKVWVSSPKVTGQRKAYNRPDSPMLDITEELLPPQYNALSTMTLTVAAGNQQKDYELKSAKQLASMDNRALAVLVTIAFSALGVLGDYFLKLASEKEHSLKAFQFYIGFALYASTAFGWVFVMKHLKLATIGVVYSVSMVVLLAVVGVVAFKETLSATEWVGVALAIVSLILLMRLN